ncbi:hypothetical protein [Aquabacter spiritensis]|uniref:Outer membrane protein with glycine zipper n=1 Tax=Aquabacter spiritensis TaxID=933073 RepID=A0A4R3LWL8_9HYPH|nr:hypothetical protein [Aquabacter spiritensis]TCT05020.1 hypothetical protein EDC64_10551 [Aquabacter spiritensis]
MKAQIFAALIGVAAVSAGPVAAQGVVGGAQQGAAKGSAIGSDAAGPVGGAVGGAIGAVGGGITGGAKSAADAIQDAGSNAKPARSAQPGTTMSPADSHGGDAHDPSPRK